MLFATYLMDYRGALASIWFTAV